MDLTMKRFCSSQSHFWIKGCHSYLHVCVLAWLQEWATIRLALKLHVVAMGEAILPEVHCYYSFHVVWALLTPILDKTGLNLVSVVENSQIP